jgi:hypothetical protein
MFVDRGLNSCHKITYYLLLNECFYGRGAQLPEGIKAAQ